MAPDDHDRALEEWVLAKVAGLDREGLGLGLGVRELPVPGVAEAAALDERVVGVVLDRLGARGLVRAIDAEPPRVLLTPAGRRGAAELAAAGTVTATATRPPEVDGSRFVFLRPPAPTAPDRRDADDVCDFHPSRRKGKLYPGEHCEGDGWVVDEATRESRACRCRPLRLRRNRTRLLGGSITPEIANLGLASSLHPELHPALHSIVTGWTHDLDRHIEEGRGLWMTVAPWDRQVKDAERLDEAYAPPRTVEEYQAAEARAARHLDAGTRAGDDGSRAGGELTLMQVRAVAQTAAGAAAAAIARRASLDNRDAAFYSLSSLYRSLVYLSRFGSYRARLDALRECELLVLVGLDQAVLERASDWQRGWLSEQLELIAIGRYEHRRATVVVSTGWPLPALERALSPETFHRLSCAAGLPLLGSRIPENARS
ncbi:MAG TPA: hypothetical protein VI318_23290 [Baekduia sp.]